MKKTILLLAVFSITGVLQAQRAPWQGKKCAVVLTYDDAIDQQLDNAVPLLDSLGFKATFYVTAFSPSVRSRLNEWKHLTETGHELGNHTLYHPCMGGPGREWVRPETDMRSYTVARMRDELLMTNLFLKSLDGKDRRTFAFTCGDQKIGDSLFINGMRSEFAAARSVRPQLHSIAEINLYDIDCDGINGETGEQLIAKVKKAMEAHALLVFLFHGVGGGHSLNVSLEAHRALLTWLKAHEQEIMIAPLLEVADHVREWQRR